jgi:hypothetical protein
VQRTRFKSNKGGQFQSLQTCTKKEKESTTTYAAAMTDVRDDDSQFEATYSTAEYVISGYIGDERIELTCCEFECIASFVSKSRMMMLLLNVAYPLQIEMS